jgi:hypothetical protein
MPDTKCPSWCTYDHAAAWARYVSQEMGGWSIPRSDGTVSVHEPVTDPAAILESWKRTEEDGFHNRDVFCLEASPDEPRRYPLQILMGQGDSDPAPHLYLSMDGPVNAAEARTIAAALLEAADTLEAQQ